MKRRFFFISLILAFCLGSISVLAYDTSDFSDVPAGHWAYSAIMEMADENLINGVGGGRFDPAGTVTAQIFLTLVGRVAFPEVTVGAGDTWYGPYVDAAREAGWLKDTKIDPAASEAAVTRYDMAAVLAKAGKRLKLTASFADSASIADYAEIPDVYRSAVETVYGQRLITGKDGGRFAGNDTMTRAEIAMVLWRLKTYAPGEAAFPDLAYYANGAMRFEPTEQSDGVLQRKFTCGPDDYDKIKAYVDLLVSEYDFELAAEPYYAHYDNLSGNKTFFDFVLNYTGTKKLTGDKLEGLTEDARGDLVIFASGKYNNLSGSIRYNKNLTGFDDGRRYGAPDVSAALAGDSAYAGLIRLADGTYQTADGRLTAAVGEAAVISGESVKIYSARFRLSASGQTILAEDASGRIRLRICFPAVGELAAGQIYTGSDLEMQIGRPFLDSVGAHIYNETYNSDKFSVLHGETYYSPVPGMSGEIKRVNVRVMRWQENETAVFHVGIQYENAPCEEEYLIAVSINPKDIESAEGGASASSSGGIPSSSSSSAAGRIRCTFVGCSDGKVRCNVCNGDGGRWVYDNSAPQYDGVGSNTGKRRWEDCDKCHGSGKIDCSRCRGTGWVSING